MIPPTNPPTHPPNYTPTYGWGSLHRFQIFKLNWNISICSSAIEFWLILGVPPGGWGVVRGCPPTHVHMSTCMHIHAHTCMHAHMHMTSNGNSQGFPQWGGHLHEIIMFNSCTCMCVHVHMCGGTPNPQSRREPQTPKFNKSWTNRDNSILFEDSLPLNIPELI